MGAQELDRRLDKEAGPSRWDEAVGNLEDARITFDRIASTLNDAIYLDEESYDQMTPVMRYTETIQVAKLCSPGQISNSDPAARGPSHWQDKHLARTIVNLTPNHTVL